MLLQPDLAKGPFLETLERAKAKYSFAIDNLVIMDRHLHPLIRPGLTSELGDIMKWILGVYSMAYNRVHRKWGQVWGGRYFSRPIENFEEYRPVYRYIDQNPVRAGLVGHPGDWPWGGIGDRLGIRTLVSRPNWWRAQIHPEALYRLAIVEAEVSGERRDRPEAVRPQGSSP